MYDSGGGRQGGRQRANLILGKDPPSWHSVSLPAGTKTAIRSVRSKLDDVVTGKKKKDEALVQRSKFRLCLSGSMVTQIVQIPSLLIGRSKHRLLRTD